MPIVFQASGTLSVVLDFPTQLRKTALRTFMKIGEAHQTAKVFEQSSFSAIHSVFEF